MCVLSALHTLHIVLGKLRRSGLFVYARARLGKRETDRCVAVQEYNHSSYLSQLPQLAVVYFFLAGVLFSIENAKCWPNLANFDQFWLFCREFTEFFGVLFIDLNNAAVY